MKTIELWFGKWDSPSIFFNILSIEFEIVPKITSLNELECFICCHGDLNVQIRYADEPFGTVGELVQKMLQLFDRLHFKLGDRHFDYTLLGREQVVIDFSKCKYMSELFKEMRKKWNGTAGMAKTLMLYGIFSEECRTKVMTLQLFVPVTLQEFHTKKTPHLLIM